MLVEIGPRLVRKKKEKWKEKLKMCLEVFCAVSKIRAPMCSEGFFVFVFFERTFFSRPEYNQIRRKFVFFSHWRALQPLDAIIEALAARV